MKLAIIDGTGVWNDDAYALAMEDSFCHQMFKQVGKPDAQYERGPSAEGYRMLERGQRAVDFFLKPAAGNGAGKEKLYLAGYSRGGSAAIMAAEILLKEGIEVDGMFLFDPVARHLSHGGEVVPANVKKLWRAYRSLDPALVAKYDHTIGTTFSLRDAMRINPVTSLLSDVVQKTKAGQFIDKPRAGIADNPFRVFFGSTGKTYLGAAKNAHTQTFRGSHGALGGVGWPHVTEDPWCEFCVAEFMNSAFSELNLKIKLKSSHYQPTSEKVVGREGNGLMGTRNSYSGVH